MKFDADITLAAGTQYDSAFLCSPVIDKKTDHNSVPLMDLEENSGTVTFV